MESFKSDGKKMRLEGATYEHSHPELTIDIRADCQWTGGSTFTINDNKKRSTKEKLQCLKDYLGNKSKNIFRKKTLYKRLPILNWLPKYNKADAIGDAVAGFTVGLTVIPQALAYSGIAKLPPAFGLYGSFLGCFVYIILGSSKDVPMGPTAIASLLTFQTARGIWQRAVLLSFLTGIIELLMGIFGLGFLVDFVSGPVASGFTSAVALIILSSQVKDIFGVNSSGSTFVDMWVSILGDIHNIRIGDTVMGLTCIAVLLLMRSMVNLRIGPKNEPKLWHTIINKTVWLICTARNAVLVFACGALGSYLVSIKSDVLRLIGTVPSGLPSFQSPPFSVPAVVNRTGEVGVGIVIQESETFLDMVKNMGSGLIVVPLIALLENIAVCKAFANGKPVDATQELIAIGTANIANSFVQGFPGSGALARGAVNNASGVRTPMGNLYSGTLVILALLFLTDYFYYIPKATLAGIIIAAVIFMVEIRVIKPMWRSNKSDLIPGLSAFISCLIFPLELGILVGIGINVVFILHHAARPVLKLETLVTKDEQKFIVLTPDRCLIFPSVEFVRNAINKHGIKSTLPVVIDCTHIYGSDFTAANVIKQLISDFKSRNQKIIFYNLKPHVLEIYLGANSGIQNFFNFENVEKAISAKDGEEIKIEPEDVVIEKNGNLNKT